MIETVQRLATRIHDDGEADDGESARLAPLWLAAAQLMLATGVGATLEQLAAGRGADGDSPAPSGLVWAPVLVAPLVAAAHLEHARNPSDRSQTAVRFLTGTAAGLGTILFIADAALNRDHAPRRIGPLAFASAGILGLLLQRQEREIDREEEALEKRAKVVERLVPRRRAKLDRIVVHV